MGGGSEQRDDGDVGSHGRSSSWVGIDGRERQRGQDRAGVVGHRVS